jgi:hypothetical protein
MTCLTYVLEEGSVSMVEREQGIDHIISDITSIMVRDRDRERGADNI